VVNPGGVSQIQTANSLRFSFLPFVFVFRRRPGANAGEDGVPGEIGGEGIEKQGVKSVVIDLVGGDGVENVTVVDGMERLYGPRHGAVNLACKLAQRTGIEFLIGYDHRECGIAMRRRPVPLDQTLINKLINGFTAPGQGIEMAPGDISLPVYDGAERVDNREDSDLCGADLSESAALPARLSTIE